MHVIVNRFRESASVFIDKLFNREMLLDANDSFVVFTRPLSRIFL